MYLVLFPIHKVHLALWLRWGVFLPLRFHLKLFAVRGFWVVLFYIAFDVLFTILRIDTGVARWAHLGGFIAGVTIALILLFSRLINARGGDILTALFKHRAWALIGHPSRPTPRLW
jgi:membrane associated rhomboid family serine protease